MTQRTVIVGATIVDGTGGPRRDADVLITDEKIRAVEPPGHLDRADARRVDGTGLVVSPGFIDIHSHADGSFLLEDDTSKILQGVTTEIVGNCGASLAPISPAFHPTAQRLLGGAARPQWQSVDEWFDAVRDRNVTHVGMLVGHGNLRELVVGAADVPVEGHHLARMRAALARGLEAGALGFSSGLVYAPGAYAGRDELQGLLAALDHEHVYATHLRNEADALLASVDEALDTAATSRARLQISHLKATGRRNHGRVQEALRRLDRARADGQRVRQDVYPYTAASTALTACLPPWALAGGPIALLARLDDMTQVERLRREVESPPPHAWENPAANAGWDGLVLAGTASGQDVGLSLSDIAAREQCSPFDGLVMVLRREQARASMVEHSMLEADVETVLQHPETIVASDGLPITAGDHPHPRLHGTFARLLSRYVRERGVLDLETAVHRVTGLPAETFGLHDRGTISPGSVADLVAFDPTTVADRATYDHPTRPPSGIAWVMQCGRTSVDSGRWLGRRRGQLLRPQP
ncbi:amidohydrolase family protein [Aeromicrobium sp.]|uniref:N-acyl-D-amino-acid deacylase family protein n=1 Tax=Aeromicrobium sp. TaxID=1871063 RepID=UPI0025C43BFF|nr:amidohydrolase family protein [Aeromicrobium sp.]MCK5892693.1 amidohydrolase family protein [Aeromicrobium sp.]